MVNATDPDRGYILAGCEAIVGVQDIPGSEHDVGSTIVRSVLTTDGGDVAAEPMSPAFVRLVPPEGSTELRVVFRAGEREVVGTVEVRTLAEAELSNCPSSGI